MLTCCHLVAMWCSYNLYLTALVKVMLKFSEFRTNFSFIPPHQGHFLELSRSIRTLPMMYNGLRDSYQRIPFHHSMDWSILSTWVYFLHPFLLDFPNLAEYIYIHIYILRYLPIIFWILFISAIMVLFSPLIFLILVFSHALGKFSYFY